MADGKKKAWTSIWQSGLKIIASVLVCAISVIPVYLENQRTNQIKIEEGIRVGMEVATEKMKQEIQETLDEKFRIYDGAILIIVQDRLESIIGDIQSEFADDIRPGQIEFVLGLYALLDDKLKSPGMDLKVENLTAYYKKITGSRA